MTKATGKAGGGVGVNFKITGDKAIDRRLKKLESKLVKKHVRAAIRKSLKPVAAKAKELAPVRSGTTRDAIRVAAGKAKRGVIRLVVMVGSGFYLDSTYYAAFLELGVKHAPAKPFLRPALASLRASSIATFLAEMRKALGLEAKR